MRYLATINRVCPHLGVGSMYPYFSFLSSFRRGGGGLWEVVVP